MNEINAAQRMRMAAKEKAEGDRVMVVTRAQGDAEAKYLEVRICHDLLCSGCARVAQMLLCGCCVRKSRGLEAIPVLLCGYCCEAVCARNGYQLWLCHTVHACSCAASISQNNWVQSNDTLGLSCSGIH